MDNTTAIGLAALLGSGLYGAGRLTHNALSALDGKPETYGGAGADKIVIRLPSSHAKKKEEAQHDVSKVAFDSWAIPASAAAMAAAYYGTNKLHDKLKKDKAEKDLNEVTEKYHSMLDKIKSTEKTASETPIVDAMCRAIVEKQAWLENLVPDNWLMPNKMPNIPIAEQVIEHTKDKANHNIIAPMVAFGGTLAAGKFLADHIKRKREEEAGRSQRLPTQIIIQQPRVLFYMWRWKSLTQPSRMN